MFISIKDRELEYCERMPLRLLGCRCGRWSGSRKFFEVRYLVDDTCIDIGAIELSHTGACWGLPGVLVKLVIMQIKTGTQRKHWRGSPEADSTLSCKNLLEYQEGLKNECTVKEVADACLCTDLRMKMVMKGLGKWQGCSKVHEAFFFFKN